MAAGEGARMRPLTERWRDVFRLAEGAGTRVSAIQVGRTRGLTSPVDLVRENFPYLR